MGIWWIMSKDEAQPCLGELQPPAVPWQVEDGLHTNPFFWPVMLTLLTRQMYKFVSHVSVCVTGLQASG